MSSAPSDGECATALSSIARTAHHLLAGMPIDGPTIQSMIWMLSEYSHHVLGVPEQIDLRAHLLQAARGEPALHVLRDYYRDHFFHALEVCFLGHFLLELRLKNGRQLWELVAPYLRLPPDRTRVLRLWYIAALLHDIGYGIEVLKGVRDLLQLFHNAPSLRELTEDLQGALQALSDKLGSVDGSLGYVPADKPGEDHGVVGAYHLRSLLRKIAESDSTVDPQQYEPAVRAIAMHNSRKHSVSFRRDPLGFLLILCDTIQEWNRPRLRFATAPVELLARLIREGRPNELRIGPLEDFRLNVAQTEADFRVADPGDTLSFDLWYSDDIQWNAGVFDLWLDASCSFQRLDFDGLQDELDIDVHYHTPQFAKQHGRPSEPQLYRLRDAVCETHMTFLERWFPTDPDDSGALTNGAVTYKVQSGGDGQRPMEHLTLHLRELCKTRRSTKGMDEFRKQLMKWRRYNEDREFAGDYGAGAP